EDEGNTTSNDRRARLNDSPQQQQQQQHCAISPAPQDASILTSADQSSYFPSPHTNGGCTQANGLPMTGEATYQPNYSPPPTVVGRTLPADSHMPSSHPVTHHRHIYSQRYPYGDRSRDKSDLTTSGYTPPEYSQKHHHLLSSSSYYTPPPPHHQLPQPPPAGLEHPYSDADYLRHGYNTGPTHAVHSALPQRSHAATSAFVPAAHKTRDRSAYHCPEAESPAKRQRTGSSSFYTPSSSSVSLLTSNGGRSGGPTSTIDKYGAQYPHLQQQQPLPPSGDVARQYETVEPTLSYSTDGNSDHKQRQALPSIHTMISLPPIQRHHLPLDAPARDPEAAAA
ncbi:hypothetical protein EV182_003320, partial [Spiromyces aspiralis]